MARNLFNTGKKNPQASSGQNEEIAKLAHKFFSDRGGEHGHDQEDWLRAEAIIKKKNLNKNGI